MHSKDVKQKMAFYEINDGALAVQMQAAFEDAQKQAREHNEPAKINLELVIAPPDKTGKYGALQYRIKKTVPGYKSMNLTTQLSPSTGLILNDGTSIADVMQESLQFKEPSLHKMEVNDGK